MGGQKLYFAPNLDLYNGKILVYETSQPRCSTW